MYEDLIDHERVRARVVKRLQPRLRLLRQRAWLLSHIVVFVVAALIYGGAGGNPLLYAVVTHDVPASSYVDPMTQQTFTNPAFTYDTHTPHAFVMLIAFVWPVLLLLHLLIYWSASRRERIIEREMARELDLEKIRLQIELAHASHGDPAEKRKRDVDLADYAELTSYDDEVRYNSNRLSL